MKKLLLHVFYLAITFMMCQASHAQSRIKKNYTMNEGAATNQLHKNVPQTYLQSALNVYYFEGFENAFPPNGWQIVDVLDTTYIWSSQVIADYPAVYEGTTSAYMHYDFNGAPGGEDWLIMPKFTVTAGDSLSLQFKFEYMGYPPDSTFILISTTDSALTSFTNVVDFIADTVTVPATVLPLWTYYSYSLNAYAGQDIYVAFKNKNIFGDGVFIDNVEIGTRPAAEVAVKSINMDSFYPSGTSNPKASVKNYGSSTQTFNVTMNITGGYSSTKSVTVLPQATTQISFDPWNAAIGNYTINALTSLAGDVNPANDTLSSFIKVLEPFVHYGWSSHDPLVAATVGGAAASICSNTNSRYFLMGGYNTTYTADAYEYDLSFATWAGINPMPAIAQYSANAKANGKLFVIGGENATTIIGNVQIYDYTTGVWTTGTAMPIPMSSAAFGTYKDSLVYIMGGGTVGAGSNAVQIYNMYTDTWTTGTPKPGDFTYGCRGGIVNNKIVVAGGFNLVIGGRVGTTYVGEIDAADPTQITWTQVADHPAGITSRSGSAVSLDANSGLVVFSGGVASNTPVITARTFAFDVNSNSWKLGPDKPTALELFYMAPVLQNDSLYLAALGGGDGSIASDKNEWLNLGYYHITTGLAENTLLVDATIFPNPAADATTLSVNLRSASQVKVSITDVTGKTIVPVCDKKLNAGNNIISLPIASLNNGLYFCTMAVDGTTFTKKLMIR